MRYQRRQPKCLTAREIQSAEPDFQQALVRLYELAYYGYGSQEAALKVLEKIVEEVRPLRNAARFQFSGMQRLYQWGLLMERQANTATYLQPEDYLSTVLAILNYEERMTLLLHSRFDLSVSDIARATNRNANRVRRVFSTAMQKLSHYEKPV